MTTISLANGVVFGRPEARIREYCEIEIYRDRRHKGGYDDRQSIDNVITNKDVQAADNLYGRFGVLDRLRIVQDKVIPHRLALINDLELGQLTDEEWQSTKTLVEPLLSGFLSIPNVKLAKTMKILHLKRPHLFPILDSLVVRFLTGTDMSMKQLSESELLQIGMASLEKARADIVANREPFRELQSALSDLPTPLTVVRMSDILCWTQEKWVNRKDPRAPYGVARLSLDQTPVRGEPAPPVPSADQAAALSKSHIKGQSSEDVVQEPEGEILSINDYRRRIMDTNGVIVIIDTARPAIAHAPLCSQLSESRFLEKVIFSNRRSGKYFWRSTLAEARKEFAAAPCRLCRPR